MKFGPQEYGPPPHVSPQARAALKGRNVIAQGNALGWMPE